jgi:hypothetical protein
MPNAVAEEVKASNQSDIIPSGKAKGPIFRHGIIGLFLYSKFRDNVFKVYSISQKIKQLSHLKY